MILFRIYSLKSINFFSYLKGIFYNFILALSTFCKNVETIDLFDSDDEEEEEEEEKKEKEEKEGENVDTSKEARIDISP